MTKKERMEQQEELKRKVNKLFDTRASSPLIINKLKKTDTVLNKVNDINEDYFASRESIAKKRSVLGAEGVAKLPNIQEEKKEDQFDGSLLTTDPSDLNNAYFKNL
jgi:hypothetical protein